MSPQDRIAFGAACAAALVLHAWALGGLARQPLPHGVDGRAVTARVVAVSPAPMPDLAVASAAPVEPMAAAGALPKTSPRSAGPSPSSDHPAPETSDGETEAPVAPTEAPAADLVAPPTAAPPPDVRPVPALLALPLHGEGALAYGFVIDGQPGEAALTFHVDDTHYALTLERRAGDRELPVWHSEGRIGPQGLQPERHQVRRRGHDRELLVFDRAADKPVLLVGARAYPLSAGTQDRLSWWLQLAALMAAEPAPHVGLVLRLPVAGPQGVHPWDFEVVARDGDRWQLRRDLPRGAGRAGLQWAVWLDGQRGFLPVELRFSLDDDEQWALRLLE